jgi:hypothetical protein
MIFQPEGCHEKKGKNVALMEVVFRPYLTSVGPQGQFPHPLQVTIILITFNKADILPFFLESLNTL